MWELGWSDETREWNLGGKLRVDEWFGGKVCYPCEGNEKNVKEWTNRDWMWVSEWRGCWWCMLCCRVHAFVIFPCYFFEFFISFLSCMMLSSLMMLCMITLYWCIEFVTFKTISIPILFQFFFLICFIVWMMQVVYAWMAGELLVQNSCARWHPFSLAFCFQFFCMLILCMWTYCCMDVCCNINALQSNSCVINTHLKLTKIIFSSSFPFELYFVICMYGMVLMEWCTFF